MNYGLIVVGPPGSGKTVFSNGMSQMMKTLKRPIALINLDPANENLPYTCDVDIRDLIQVEDAMKAYKLGPNGGLLYCIEFLEKNLQWLREKLEPFRRKSAYFIFDCPGQVELYTVHDSMRNIIVALSKSNLRLCCVHLVDSVLCTKGTAFVAAVLLSLSTSLQLELPHINVLTKIDLLPKYGQLDFNLDFYTDVMDLRRVVTHENADGTDDGTAAWSARHKALNEALCGLIDDFSLVGFETLDIGDKESVLTLVRACDKAIGYIPNSSERDGDRSSMAYAVALCGIEFAYERALAVQEKVYFEEQQVNKQHLEEANRTHSATSTSTSTATTTTTTTQN